MGEMYRVFCKNCHIIAVGCLGIGGLFPYAYRKTVEEFIAGKRGEIAQEFMKQHPNGTINCSYDFFVCDKCGEIQVKQNLSMYIPKADSPKKEYPWSFPEERYTLFAKYPHRCSKCHGKVTEYSIEELEAKIKAGEIKCPYCGEEIELQFTGCWD